MFLPNPLAFAAVKVVAYSGLGAAVWAGAPRRGNPIAFGLARAILGWVVGVPVLLLVQVIVPAPSDGALVAALALPRLALTALLLRRSFAPAPRAVLGWAAVSVLLASLIDLVLLAHYQEVSWLRLGWC